MRRQIEMGATYQCLREDLGISRRKMAELVGVSYGTMRRFEEGLNVRSREAIEKSVNYIIEAEEIKKDYYFLLEMRADEGREMKKKAVELLGSLECLCRRLNSLR